MKDTASTRLLVTDLVVPDTCSYSVEEPTEVKPNAEVQWLMFIFYLFGQFIRLPLEF